MLQIQALTKIHPIKVPALLKLDWQIEAGQTLCVFGGFGSGKTTLLRMLAGMTRPTNGRIVWDTAYASLPIYLKLGYMPSNFPFPPHTKPIEWLRYLAALNGLEGVDFRHRLDCLVGICGMGPFMEKGLPEKSPMLPLWTRLLGLMQAQLFEPALLLLDDPLWNLDYSMANRFWDCVQALRGKDQTVIFSTKRSADLPPFTDEILWLVNGHRRAILPLSKWPEYELDLQGKAISPDLNHDEDLI